MKSNIKFILLSICLLTSAFALNAQQRRSKYISEFRGGLNFSEMDLSNYNSDKQIKLGFLIGGSFAWRVYGPVYVRTGLDITKKGLKQHDTSETTAQPSGLVTKQDKNIKIDANYFQIPAMIGFEQKLTKVTSINFYAGGYGAYGFRGKTNTSGGYILNANTNISTYVPIATTEEDTFIPSRLKRWDYGVVANVGFVYDILSLSLGYEYGMCNISNNKSLNWKNRNTVFVAAVRF